MPRERLFLFFPSLSKHAILRTTFHELTALHAYRTLQSEERANAATHIEKNPGRGGEQLSLVKQEATELNTLYNSTQERRHTKSQSHEVNCRQAVKKREFMCVNSLYFVCVCACVCVRLLFVLSRAYATSPHCFSSTAAKPIKSAASHGSGVARGGGVCVGVSLH